MAPPDVAVREPVRRPAGEVWAALADPTQIAVWSPENTGASTPGGEPLPVGAVFGGRNRHGIFRWSTTCTVVESEPGRAFAFDVSFFGLPVARWRYVITSSTDGCVVEEQWWDRRGALMKAAGAVGTGVPDRATHNEQTMRHTLAAMRADLESR